MTASLRPVGGHPSELIELLEPWVRFGSEPLIVRTSGSTGEPKDVVLSHRAVLASARNTLDRLGGPGEWLLAVPVAGIAGLQVLVRSILSGTTPAIAADHGDLSTAVESLVAAPASSGRRYTSLVPTQVHRLAESGDLGLLADFDAVLVGGAAMPADLRARAAEAGVHVVRTYGMTETCGGCVYDGVPLGGVDVKVDEHGQVWIAGDTLFDGYTGEPRDGEWFATADLGEFKDGRLSITGRIDEVAISGGVNVSMPAVERALRAADAVADVSVVGVDDPEWGTRVVAVVVPVDPVSIDHGALRDRVVEAGLPRTWAPRQIVQVDNLPFLPSGKVDRERLRTIVHDAGI
jgi:O-succinylbenzoic acid--CoA ligase